MQECYIDFSVVLKEDFGLLQKNFELAKEQVLIYRPQMNPTQNVHENVNLVRIDDNWQFRFGDAAYRINGHTGYIDSITKNSEELLKSPLILNFWRPPTDNDIGNGMPERCAGWRNAATDASLHAIKQMDNHIITHFFLEEMETDVYLKYSEWEWPIKN